ncbi:hypothetical protein FJ661_17930 [Pseudarthrobacter phenanthrenivorans]|uniref:DoxX family protein n=1 Tax=Pseudarthrobacter phenanthrenivorans TaxID=361575 RepID=UPI0011260EA9|nr:hypothetical protein [Pseudarthrobacter phenanthrenivorans]TPV48857.1 hypothetical protein FJ661_17930 [Pseudarthrobacter phenanthrenivorans]
MLFPRSGRAVQTFSAAAMSSLLAASAMKHFRDPAFYHQVVPDFLCRDDAGASPGAAPPRPLALLSREEWIAVSGLLELAAAVGILVPATRKAAATGTAVMFTAFLAGHLDALRRAYGPQGSAAQRKVHTVRLPLQAPLIAWAWSLRKPAAGARP